MTNSVSLDLLSLAVRGAEIVLLKVCALDLLLLHDH
jgi:hypothetical protein